MASRAPPKMPVYSIFLKKNVGSAHFQKESSLGPPFCGVPVPDDLDHEGKKKSPACRKRRCLHFCLVPHFPPCLPSLLNFPLFLFNLSGGGRFWWGGTSILPANSQIFKLEVPAQTLPHPLYVPWVGGCGCPFEEARALLCTFNLNPDKKAAARE